MIIQIVGKNLMYFQQERVGRQKMEKQSLLQMVQIQILLHLMLKR